MFLMPLLAAAAVITPLTPPAEADMRCAVAMLYATGMASEKKNEAQIIAFTSATAFYTGKLAVKAPDLDLSAQIDRLTNDNTFLREIDNEVQRCALEAGTAMQRMGTSASGT